MSATLVKVGHALRVSLALHGPIYCSLVMKLTGFDPLPSLNNISIQRHILKKQLIMTVSPNNVCPDKVH